MSAEKYDTAVFSLFQMCQTIMCVPKCMCVEDQTIRIHSTDIIHDKIIKTGSDVLKSALR